MWLIICATWCNVCLKVWIGKIFVFRENTVSKLGFERNKVHLLYFQIQYNIIVRTGRRTYPRYFRIDFAFNRAKYRAQPRPINITKLQLQAQVIELRSKGWSFPAIAKRLDISVGTAWNMTKDKT